MIELREKVADAVMLKISSGNNTYRADALDFAQAAIDTVLAELMSDEEINERLHLKNYIIDEAVKNGIPKEYIVQSMKQTNQSHASAEKFHDTPAENGMKVTGVDEKGRINIDCGV